MALNKWVTKVAPFSIAITPSLRDAIEWPRESNMFRRRHSFTTVFPWSNSGATEKKDKLMCFKFTS